MTSLIDQLWAQIESTVFITRDQFERGLAEWEIELVEVDGEAAFAGLTKGPEFHFASFGTGHRITMAMIRDHLYPIIARYGYVTTTTPSDESRQHRINLLLGFKVVGTDEFFTMYRLDGGGKFQ